MSNITKQTDNKKKVNPLIKIIDQTIRRTGFDQNFIAAAQHHIKLLNNYKNGDNVDQRIQLCCVLMSKLFIDKLDMYPTRKFNCQVDENSGWPVPVLPSEVFGGIRIPDSYRRKCFYKCLKVADILECRVSAVQPTEYHLRVIHKYGTTRILDDLNLKVSMARNKEEFTILQKDLLACELIRVAVKEINNEDQIYVTVNEKSVQFTKMIPKLGVIQDQVLPPYVLDPLDPERYSSYSEYLNSMPQFRNPTSLPSIFVGFGIDPFVVHSYYQMYNGLKCTDDCAGEAVLMESKLKDAKSYTRTAMQEYEKKRFDAALNWVEKALQLCPPQNPLLASLYEIRADIQASKRKPKVSKIVALDLELAYAADPNNEGVKKKYAHVLYKGGNSFYKKKMYKEAAAALEQAKFLDPEHCFASILLEHIKYKHRDTSLNLDDVSLSTLEEKKKELVTKLKKIS